MKRLIISNILSLSILVAVIFARHIGLLSDNVFRASGALAYLPMIVFYRKPIIQYKKAHLGFAVIVSLCAGTIVNQEGQNTIWPFLIFILVAAVGAYYLYSSLNISITWKF